MLILVVNTITSFLGDTENSPAWRSETRPGANRATAGPTGRCAVTGSVSAMEGQVGNTVRVRVERAQLSLFHQRRGLSSYGAAASQTTPSSLEAPHFSTSTTRTTSGGNPRLPSYRTIATTWSGKLTRRNLSPARRLLKQVRRFKK